mmetsp:Transcript_26791/g.61762  ORF Transcript_26791/g.61762 Transcript_26791/m.61762 type:complete len:631 (-) Transcript_26791:278-2170(-)
MRSSLAENGSEATGGAHKNATTGAPAGYNEIKCVDELDSLFQRHFEDMKAWMQTNIQAGWVPDVAAEPPKRETTEHDIMAMQSSQWHARSREELAVSHAKEVVKPVPTEQATTTLQKVVGQFANHRETWFDSFIDTMKMQNGGKADIPKNPASLVEDSQQRRAGSMRTMRDDWESKMQKRLTDLTAEESYWSKLGKEPDTCLARFASGNLFRVIVAAVIFINAVCIGLEVEDSMQRVLNDPLMDKPDVYVTLNLCFTGFFMFELVVRLAGQQRSFFFGSECRWNIFDLLLVMLSVMDLASSVEGGLSAGYIRLLKILRMVRVLRIVRVLRFFRSLRRMVTSIMSSMSALCWALFLLGIIMYVFAVVFMQAGVNHLDGHLLEDESGEWQRARQGFKKYYNSLGESLFSLTKAISGGDDWGDMTTPLKAESRYYVVAFVFYVLFVVFGVLNVLAGVFLDSAAEALDLDRNWLTEAETIKGEKFVKNLTTLFKEMDLNASGSLTWSEFLEAMEDKSIQALFVANELDIADAHMVFSLLSTEQEEVSLSSFVNGCTKLKGNAKSAQIMCLMRETEAFRKEVAERLAKMHRTMMQTSSLQTSRAPDSKQRPDSSKEQAGKSGGQGQGGAKQTMLV